MPKTNMTLEQRFWAKVDKNQVGTGCWEWTAYVNACGYGMFKTPERVHLAHRIAHAWLRGGIPDGVEADHLCRNRRCVNPSHVELVPHAENVRRSLRHMRPVTHCKHGHEFTEANTYRNNGKRACKACMKRLHDAWVAKGGLAAWKAKRAAAAG